MQSLLRLQVKQKQHRDFLLSKSMNPSLYAAELTAFKISIINSNYL